MLVIIHSTFIFRYTHKYNTSKNIVSSRFISPYLQVLFD